MKQNEIESLCCHQKGKDMRGEQSPNGLLYAGEHLSCKNYMTDISTGFKYIKFDKEKCIEEEYTHKNYLLFF